MLQNFIELLTIPFGAGESRLLHVSGQYFEIIDAPSPIDVLLLDHNGTQRGIMRGAEASFHLKNTEFATIQITSAAAQTVRIGYGSGEAGTRRAAGSVNIANVPTVELNAATLAALLAHQQPFSPSGSYAANGALAANTADVVFAPGANVNGAILLSASYNLSDNTTIQPIAAFVAKASAPANIMDGAVVALAAARLMLSSQPGYSIDMQSPQFIPAGLGLYFIATPALPVTQSQARAARYRLL